VKTYAATGGKDFNPELPTVLFVHGSGLDHRGWALQTRWFAFHGFSVLAPDLPGHSMSDGSPLETIEEMGKWLSDFMEAAGVKSAHIVGHSQGFLCALELAKNHLDKVKSLSAIGTAASIPVNPALIETAKKSAVSAAEMMLQWGFGEAAHMGESAVPGMQPIAIGRQIMGKNPLAQDLQACSDYGAGAQIASSLDIPAHVILGSADKMTPMRGGVALAETLKAGTTILENYGHMLPIEAPRQCLDALRAFIEPLERLGEQ
jgi:pimeloyl-ACP methyl ester carboxylesterase